MSPVRSEHCDVSFPPHRGYIEKIRCSFCRGKGLDPFGLLAPGSKCQVCNGLGDLYVLKPYIKCAYCKGTGVEPYIRNTCLSCKGRGVISQHKGDYLLCGTCHGCGMDHETGLTCLSCKGCGVVET